MLARLSALCCEALAHGPLLVPVLVIVGHQRAAFGVSLRFPFFPQCAITSTHVERYVVRYVDRTHNRMLRPVSTDQERFQ
jgi:hypothetical protein